MREITRDDKLFFYERNFFTLDGLWIIEVENATDWDTALKVDIIVWQRLYQVIFRRVKKYLGITSNSIDDLIEILAFCWSCEGYEYQVLERMGEKTILQITSCPYKASMDRNPDRHHRIADICVKMCVPFYEPAIEEFNPAIKLSRNTFLGAGGACCDFVFTLTVNDR